MGNAMTGQQPKVLLTTLTERVSAKGNVYLSGWLAKARVVGFRGEDDEHGHPTWNLYLQEPEPRPHAAPSEPREAPTADRPAATLLAHPPHVPERPGWATQAPVTSPEQRRAERANKAAYEAQRGHNQALRDLNDPVPD